MSVPKQENKEEEKKYLMSENLGVIPCAAEKKVAIVIHCISSGNKAVYLNRPPDSPKFVLHDFDGEDLQATEAASMCWDGSICIKYGSHERCNQTK
jgi:hypothetical protein